MIPDSLKYSKDHGWVRMEGNCAVIGMTDHAQEALGSVIYVEVPTVGRRLAQHDELGVIESVKAATSIFAPLAGTVAVLNPALASDPELINKDPYGGGWICRMADCDASGLAGLMDSCQYARYVG